MSSFIPKIITLRIQTWVCRDCNTPWPGLKKPSRCMNCFPSSAELLGSEDIIPEPVIKDSKIRTKRLRRFKEQ